MPNSARSRRRPPVRIILGQRVRFAPLVDQQITAMALLDHRTFEQQVRILIGAALGI